MSDGSVELSSNVVSLHGGPTGERKPSPMCIEAIEEVLELAKAGEITGVAIASVYFDGRSDYRLSGFVGGYGLLGAVTMLQADIVAINQEPSE